MASDIIQQPALPADYQLPVNIDDNFIEQCKKIIAYRDKVALNALKQKIVQSRTAAAAAAAAAAGGGGANSAPSPTTVAVPVTSQKEQASSFVSKPLPKVHKDFEAERTKIVGDIHQDYLQSLAPRRIDPSQFGFREDTFLRSLKEAVGPPQPYQGHTQRPDHIPSLAIAVNKAQSQKPFSADVYGIGNGATTTAATNNNNNKKAAIEQAKANYPIKQEDMESDDQYEPQETSFSSTASMAPAPSAPEPIPGLKHIQSSHPSPESRPIIPPPIQQKPATTTSVRRPLKRYDDEDFQHSAPQRKVARTDQSTGITADMYSGITSRAPIPEGPQYTDQSHQPPSVPYGSEPQGYPQYTPAATPVVRHPQPSRYFSTPRIAHMSPTMVANDQGRRQSAIPLYSDAHPSDIDGTTVLPRDTYSPTFEQAIPMPQPPVHYPYDASRNRSGMEPPGSSIGHRVIFPHQTDSTMSEYDPLHPEIPMSRPNDIARYGALQQHRQQLPTSASSSSYLRPPLPPDTSAAYAFRLQQQQEQQYNVPYPMGRNVQQQQRSTLPAGSEISPPNPYMMYRKHPAVSGPPTNLPRYTDAYPAEPIYGDMHPSGPPPPPTMRPESRVYYPPPPPPQQDYNPYYNGM